MSNRNVFILKSRFQTTYNNLKNVIEKGVNLQLKVLLFLQVTIIRKPLIFSKSQLKFDVASKQIELLHSGSAHIKDHKIFFPKVTKKIKID